MQCPTKSSDGVEMLIAYGARTLSPEAELYLERHLTECQECRSVADAQRGVWSTMDAWEPMPVSHDFDTKLYRRIAAEDALPWYRRLFRIDWSMRPAMPVAAACAAVLTVFLLKGPLLDTHSHIDGNARSVDIEQVERALDDINMLQQLGVVPPANSQARPESL